VAALIRWFLSPPRGAWSSSRTGLAILAIRSSMQETGSQPLCEDSRRAAFNSSWSEGRTVMNGAAVSFDLDLVTPSNQEPETTLKHLDGIGARADRAIWRARPSQPATRYGPIDLLGRISQNLSFPDLLPHSAEMLVGEGCRSGAQPGNHNLPQKPCAQRPCHAPHPAPYPSRSETSKAAEPLRPPALCYSIYVPKRD
jgi:hypothetical protein